VLIITDHRHYYLRTDLRACALSIESSLYSNARSTACSALTSPAVVGVQAPRKHAAAVVNLQQLEGSLKPQDSGRFGQACPEHRVRRYSASLSSVSPEHALALQAVVRVTSPFTIPSSAIASHVVIFLLLPACE
jgi:hypothetical protein